MSTACPALSCRRLSVGCSGVWRPRFSGALRAVPGRPVPSPWPVVWSWPPTTATVFHVVSIELRFSLAPGASLCMLRRIESIQRQYSLQMGKQQAQIEAGRKALCCVDEVSSRLDLLGDRVSFLQAKLDGLCSSQDLGPIASSSQRLVLEFGQLDDAPVGAKDVSVTLPVPLHSRLSPIADAHTVCSPVAVAVEVAMTLKKTH